MTNGQWSHDQRPMANGHMTNGVAFQKATITISGSKIKNFKGTRAKYFFNLVAGTGIQ